jgi:hypothetical protein
MLSLLLLALLVRVWFGSSSPQAINAFMGGMRIIGLIMRVSLIAGPPLVLAALVLAAVVVKRQLAKRREVIRAIPDRTDPP